MYCPRCGTQNDDNAFKCIKCGTIVQQVPPPIVRVKKSNIAVIVLAAVGGVMAIFAVIGILAAIAIPQYVAFRDRAFDAQAYAEIRNACSEAYIFFTEHPERSITLDDLRERGFRETPDIELIIEDGTRENMTIRVKHKKGKKIYVANKNCNIQEINP